MLILLAVAVPGGVAAVYATFGWNRFTRWLAALAALSVLVSGLVIKHQPITVFSGEVRTDPLAGHLLVVMGGVAGIAVAGAVTQLGNEIADRVIGVRTAGGFGVLSMVALATGSLSVFATSRVGALLALEVSIMAVTGLVAARKASALRAAVMYGACSTGGIGLTLLSLALPDGSFTTVVELVGLGTVAGLAPLHWWLAPTATAVSAPVAAVIAGVPTSLAWGQLLRLQSPPRELLATAAAVTVVLAVVGLIRRADLRAFIADLGVATTGLLCLSLAVGARDDGLRLLLCLGVNTAILYLAAGHVVSLTGSGRIAMVRGLLERSALLGQVWGLGLFVTTILTHAVFGYRLVTDAFEVGLAPAGVVVAIGLTAVAVAAGVVGARILTGDSASVPDVTTGPPRRVGAAGPLLALVIAVAVLLPITPPDFL